MDLTFSKHDPDPVATALGTRGHEAFFDALQWVECKTRDVPTETLTPNLRMIRVLWWLDLEATDGRVEQFVFNVERGYAPQVPEAAAFARQIGARRTAELLERVIAIFPGGMPQTYRAFVLADQGGVVSDALEALEGEFEGFSTELRGALRKWLRSNQAAVRAELELAAGGPAGEKGAAAKAKKTAKSSAVSLASVLATTDADPTHARLAFLSAAVAWVHTIRGRRNVPFESLPESARMIVQLNELVSALNSSGLLYLADWTIGDDFVSLRKWLTEIHAARSGEYLDAFAALFPRKKVPADRDERSDALVRAVEKRSKKGPDPIDALDDEYRKAALDEIPDRLREWLTLHRARVEAEQLGDPGADPDELLLDASDHLSSLARLQAYGRKREKEGQETMPVSPVAIGDVVALKTRKGFAYLQVTHEHVYMDVHGPVLRVVDGLTKTKLEGAALAKHVAGATRFFTCAWLAHWMPASPRRLTVAARALPIPAHAHAFPPFLFHWGSTRDGRPVFGEWSGGARPVRAVVGPLNDEQLKMNAARMIDLDTLADDIAGAWSPAREHMGYH